MPLQPPKRHPIHKHPLIVPPHSVHHFIHPMVGPPIRSMAPHPHLSHHPLKQRQLPRTHPPNHMRPAPIGNRVGLKRDMVQKLGCIRLLRPGELVKVAPWGRDRSARSGTGRGTDEKGPVKGKGLAGFVFAAPELGEFDRVTAGGDWNWVNCRRARTGGCWDGRRTNDGGGGGGSGVARSGGIGWVGRVSLRGCMGICTTRVTRSTRQKRRGTYELQYRDCMRTSFFFEFDRRFDSESSGMV